jgi:hypothetical protein
MMVDELPSDISPAPNSMHRNQPPYSGSPIPSEAGSSISNISNAITELETRIMKDLPTKIKDAVMAGGSLGGDKVDKGEYERLANKVKDLEDKLTQASVEGAAATSAKEHLERECEKWEKQCSTLMQMIANR